MPGSQDMIVTQQLLTCLLEKQDSGRVRFRYLAEGAANVVFTITYDVDSTPDQGVGKYVLRMRKNLPFTVPTKQTLHEFEDRVSPLFTFDPSLIIPVIRFEIIDETLEILNKELHILEDENQRPTNRQHVYLPALVDEPFAILMPNLYYGPGKVIEFKPKWLIQSPSAPKDAQRCRTCALNAMRRQQNVSIGRGDSGLCPLDLLSTHQAVINTALENLWDDPRTLPLFAGAFEKKVQPILRYLQKLQLEHGQVGLYDFLSPEGKDFSLAMALRDCSIFLKAVTSPDDSSVDITLMKILDLDLKDSGGGKLAKWASMEQSLINDGWYTSIEGPARRCAL